MIALLSALLLEETGSPKKIICINPRRRTVGVIDPTDDSFGAAVRYAVLATYINDYLQRVSASCERGRSIVYNLSHQIPIIFCAVCFGDKFVSFHAGVEISHRCHGRFHGVGCYPKCL